MLKLQHLTVIFAIIIIPISLLMGYYIRSEIDTMKLQIEYDEKLINSTYDAVKAYQINTANNFYSILNRSQRRDIEAAANTFITSFATGLGLSGYGEAAIKPYMPAMVFTLYDGYYIYGPAYNDAPSKQKYENILKPYISYSQRYIQGDLDVVITYSLDTYITVTGTKGGAKIENEGYLSTPSTTTREALKETLLIYNTETGEIDLSKEYQYVYPNGEKWYYDPDANASGQHWFIYREGEKKYISVDPDVESHYLVGGVLLDDNAELYKTASDSFRQWMSDYGIINLTVNDLVLESGIESRNKLNIHYYHDSSKKIFNFNDPSKPIDAEDSVFNIHKSDMIKMSIKENLNSAITAYNAHAGTNTFVMPILNDAEWDQITKNICVITFIQGLPAGFKTYNNYAIVTNTRNETFIDKDSLVYINTEDPDSTYHKIDCPKFTQTDASKILGMKKTDYEATTVEVNEPGKSTKTKLYYYKHKNLPCYYCIVSRNYTSTMNAGKEQAQKQTLARERQLLQH